MATFNGTNPRSVSINASDPYGDQYAVCTTNQYDLRPSTNSSTLAVLLQSTDAITASKTAEQTEQQAQNSGWLNVYSQWSWWYPWYRLHVGISLNGAKLDVGFSPILPGCETFSGDGLGFFSELTAEAVQDFAVDIGTIFGAYIVAKLTGWWNIGVGIVSEFVKFGVQMLLLVGQTSGLGLLASAVCSFLMGIIAIKIDLAKAFLSSLWSVLAGTTSALLYQIYEILCGMLATAQVCFRGIVDVLESLLDFITGGFALAKYWGLD
jgi:hypothetical protein